MKINDNVYFTKRPKLKGKVIEIMPNGVIKVNFTDEDGILVKKGRTKKLEVGESDVTVYREASKGSTIKGLPTKQQVFNYWNNQINKDPKRVGGYWDSTMLDINSTLMSENAIQHFGVYTEKGDTEIEEDIYDWGSEFHYDWEQKNKKYAKGTTIKGGNTSNEWCYEIGGL